MKPIFKTTLNSLTTLALAAFIVHAEITPSDSSTSVTVDLGAYPTQKRYPLGTSFESFGTGWKSLRLDPEIGHAWKDIPPVINTQLRYPLSEQAYVYFRLGLRRDLAAWHQDALGGNVPLTPNEVDLNEPSLGYLHFENAFFVFTIGRFQVHWSPSPDFGLALSRSVPYHNAAEFAIKTPRVQYRFLVSSLNPWLEGTPTGDSASVNYPVGSEEYRQRHYQNADQALLAHNRVYDDRIKTLIAHRLEGTIGPVLLGITEVQVLGGKVPELRDGNPFVFFHNDFKDGYTNLGLSIDANVKLPLHIRLFSELFLDDVAYTPTEGSNNTPSLLGYLAGVEQSFVFHEWFCNQRLQFIHTDPFLYSYLQPLNTLASRQILTSNYYPPVEQNSANTNSATNPIIDKLVIDYPLGYFRGGDAVDLWYRFEAKYQNKISVTATAGVLSKGDVNLYTPYDNYYTASHDAPTGIVERELRLRLDGAYYWQYGLQVHGGLGLQSLENESNIQGQKADHFQVGIGLAWSFPK